MYRSRSEQCKFRSQSHSYRLNDVPVDIILCPCGVQKSNAAKNTEKKTVQIEDLVLETILFKQRIMMYC